ncbi:MAG: hypothetical protein ACRDD2_07270 [Sarcina sp.]
MIKEYKAIYREAINLLKLGKKLNWLEQFNTEFLMGFQIYLLNVNSKKTKELRNIIIEKNSMILNLREVEGKSLHLKSIISL